MENSLFWFLLFLPGLGVCQRFEVIAFHDSCGLTIDKTAGELWFDARELPSYLPGNKCSVTVSPRSDVFHADTRVLFYFTQFNISIFCEDTNLTVTDGTLYSGGTVKGLPNSAFCGHNKTLEDTGPVFTTSGNQLTVTFRRSDYGRRFLGYFTINFIQFHTGTCKGEGLYECENGRCIPSEYYCSNYINACGDVEDTCDGDGDEEAEANFFDTFLSNLQNYAWIVVVIVVMYMIMLFYRRYQHKIRSAIGRLTSSSSQRSRRNSETMDSVQLDDSTTHDIHFRDTENQESTAETLLSSARASQDSAISGSPRSSISSNSCHDDVSPRDVDLTSSGIQQTNPTPSCPPPSYDEIMAKND